ncbi:MAG: hypothetical protein NWF08_06930 [Candidatus Bathyarchaeota archaeon]|nr:hypothetical protein [Candidatus Bathyarchaeota archaeon]
MDKRIKIILILSLLSPFIGEMVSGSSPPLEFFNPVVFLILWGLYGGGVIIVRELWVKWGRGYSRLMLLGLVYGIIEEGLAVKSFFDPEWQDLGKLAVYGRFLGVNFVWSVWLSIFHAVFSITIPILLIQTLYSDYKNKKLISNKGFKIVSLAFILTCILIFFFLNPYLPPPIQYLLCALLAFYLIKKAKGKIKKIQIPNLPIKRPVLRGIFFTATMFILFFIVPETPIPWIIPCIVSIILFLQLYQKLNDYTKKQIIELVICLLVPFLLFFNIVLEINGITGMSLVGTITFISLIWLYKQTR